MKVINEENNQEVEVIGIEDLEEMKLKLYSIEEKISKGTATNEEVKFAMNIFMDTRDYSDLLIIPDSDNFGFQSKTDYQTIGSLVDESLINNLTEPSIKQKLDKIKDLTKIVRCHTRIGKKSIDIMLLAGKKRPFKKQMDSFFALLDENKKVTEAYAKKWLK